MQANCVVPVYQLFDSLLFSFPHDSVFDWKNCSSTLAAAQQE